LVAKRHLLAGPSRLTAPLAPARVLAFQAWAFGTVRESPSGSVGTSRQGWCNTKLGRIDDACRAYDRALEIIEATEGPADPMAHSIQAYLFGLRNAVRTPAG
jgi:hypothetical protein